MKGHHLVLLFWCSANLAWMIGSEANIDIKIIFEVILAKNQCKAMIQQLFLFPGLISPKSRLIASGGEVDVYSRLRISRLCITRIIA